jgi:hypothetical protein
MSRRALMSADLSYTATPIPLAVKEQSDAGKDCSADRHVLCDVGRVLCALLRAVWMWFVRAMLRATICRAPMLSAMPTIPALLPAAHHFTVSLRARRLTAGSLQRSLDQIRSLSFNHDANRPGPGPTNAQYSVFPAAALSRWPDGRTSTRPADRQPLLRANQQSPLRPHLRRSAIPAKPTAITGEFL